MLVETFPVGPLGCNCSILVDEKTRSSIVIDPGGDFDVIKARLDALQAHVEAVVHTHGHVDHVGATAPLCRSTGAVARIHEADLFVYDLLPVQSAMIGIEAPERCEMTSDLVDGLRVCAGSVELTVIHTPGHSPGSVTFLAETDGKPIAFTGDTLFLEGVGRTDLWGGDAQAILRSVRERLFTLDEATVVVPGHGGETTIAHERRSNPYVRRR